MTMRTWAMGLVSIAGAIVIGACAHIYDDGMGEGSHHDRVSVTYPRNGAQLLTDDLAVAGTSTEGTVRVMVFDPYDRLVTRTSLTVRDGRWGTRFNLREGRYRIRVTTRRDEQREMNDVRVAYRDASLREGRGWNDREHGGS